MLNYDIKKMYEWPFGARALVLVFVSVLILLFGYVIDIVPYRTQIQASAAQEEDLKGQLQLMINQQVTMKNDIAQLPAVKALLLDWQKKILTKEELSGVLDEILKIGQDNNLKIISFNPTNEIKDGIYYKTPVSIDMTGTYNQIAIFISQLANMPKLINIDAFTITNDQNKSPSNDSAPLAASDDLFTAELDIEIYRR